MLWLVANLTVGYVMKEFGKRGLNDTLGLIAYALIIYQGIKLVFSLFYWIRIGCFELSMNNRD